MRLIDADKLKDYAYETYQANGVELETIMVVPLSTIDNAPTVPLPDFKEGYKRAIIDGKTNFSRPQGKWVKIVDGTGFVSHVCSECGAEIELEDCSDDKFCFNCGADMKGEE